MRVSSPTRRVVTLLAVVAVALLAGPFAGVASADGAADGAAGDAAAETAAVERSASEFISLINSYRAAHGVAGLTVDGSLSATAQSWAGSMAASGTLAHDPNLVNEISGWTKIGENVGVGPSVSSIWSSFLASPPHVANLLDPAYTHLGVGFVSDGHGGLWTTHRFMRVESVSAPAPPAAPAPTAPPATTAPAPTTTAPPPPANPGDAVDCSDYGLWVEANGWYAVYAPYYGDVAGLDPDGDGVPCEDLAGAPSWALANNAPAVDAGASQPTGDGAAADDGGSKEDAKSSADPERVAEVIDALRTLPG